MQQRNMRGKIVLVTGATSGIGKATAEALAGMGAHVVITGRNLDKIAATLDELRNRSGSQTIDGLQADFESLAEVRHLAQDFEQRYDRLDVLINNAGALFGERGETKDGIEKTFAVNHLAPFLLTNLLLPMLQRNAPSRIINVSSDGHRLGQLDFNDLESRNKYNGMVAYGRSKLMNVLFTYELSRKLQGTGVTVNALHPGGVATNFGAAQPGLINRLLRFAIGFGRTPEQGAQTSIYLASAPELPGVTAKYFVDCKARPSSKASYDLQAAEQLWQVSERMTGLDTIVLQSPSQTASIGA